MNSSSGVPRCKVRNVQMQRQLDDISTVTAMSMDVFSDQPQKPTTKAAFNDLARHEPHRDKTQWQQSHSDRAAAILKDVRISDHDGHGHIGPGEVGHHRNSNSRMQQEGGMGERRMAPQPQTNKHAGFKEPKNDQGAGNPNKHSQRLPSGRGGVSKSRPSMTQSDNCSMDATTITTANASGYSDEVATLFKIDPSEHDARGWCVRHPQVRLRKKRIFGGWKILLAACPECCVDELRRMQALKELERESKRGARGAEHDPVAITLVGNKPKIQPTISSLTAPAGTAANPEDFMPKDSFQYSSTPTAGHTPDDTSTPIPSSHKSSHEQRVCKEDKKGEHKKSKSKIQRPSLQIEWVDDKGRHGVYNGQINKDLVPHGEGRMVYDNGSVKEGTWKNGRYRRNKSRRHHHSNVGLLSGLEKSEQLKTPTKKTYRKRPKREKEWEYYH